MSKSFHLVLSLPEGEPVSHRLTSERVTLGRAEENSIRLELKSVSSRHCEFRAGPDGYELIDLGSTNGTKVNGMALNGHAVPLKNGDRIVFAESVSAHFFAAVEASGPASAPKPKAPAAKAGQEEWDEWLPINPVAAAVAQQEGTLHHLLNSRD